MALTAQSDMRLDKIKPAALLLLASLVLTSPAPAISWTRVSTSGSYFTSFEGSELLLDSNHTLYLLGGNSAIGPSNFANDVWRSSDGGCSWSKLSVSSPFSARSFFVALVEKRSDKFFVMSGYSGVGTYADAWTSTDLGLSWTSVLSGSGYPSRFMAAGVMDSASGMYIIGGWSSYRANA